MLRAATLLLIAATYPAATQAYMTTLTVRDPAGLERDITFQGQLSDDRVEGTVAQAGNTYVVSGSIDASGSVLARVYLENGLPLGAVALVSGSEGPICGFDLGGLTGEVTLLGINEASPSEVGPATVAASAALTEEPEWLAAKSARVAAKADAARLADPVPPEIDEP